MNSLKAADARAKAGRLVARTVNRILDSVTLLLQITAGLACMHQLSKADWLHCKGALLVGSCQIDIDIRNAQRAMLLPQGGLRLRQTQVGLLMILGSNSCPQLSNLLSVLQCAGACSGCVMFCRSDQEHDLCMAPRETKTGACEFSGSACCSELASATLMKDGCITRPLTQAPLKTSFRGYGTTPCNSCNASCSASCSEKH